MGILTIVLSGNIAAGKSTAGPLLAQHLNACYVAEPVEQWRHSGLLKKFYETQNAFEFQSYVLQSRASALNAALVQWRYNHNDVDPGLIVMDRWLADDYMFAEVNLHLGTMTAEEFTRYKVQYKDLATAFNQHLTIKTIWLDTPPQTCLARLHSRGRAEELKITHEYLCCLDERRPPCDFIYQPQDLPATAIAKQLTDYINQHFRPCLYITDNLKTCQAWTPGKTVITNAPKNDMWKDILKARTIIWAAQGELFLKKVNLDNSVVFIGTDEFAGSIQALNLVGSVQDEDIMAARKRGIWAAEKDAAFK